MSIVIDVITVRCHPTTQTILSLDTITTNYLSLNSYQIMSPIYRARSFERLGQWGLVNGTIASKH